MSFLGDISAKVSSFFGGEEEEESKPDPEWLAKDAQATAGAQKYIIQIKKGYYKEPDLAAHQPIKDFMKEYGTGHRTGEELVYKEMKAAHALYGGGDPQAASDAMKKMFAD